MGVWVVVSAQKLRKYRVLKVTEHYFKGSLGEE